MKSLIIKKAGPIARIFFVLLLAGPFLFAGCSSAARTYVLDLGYEHTGQDVRSFSYSVDDKESPLRVALLPFEDDRGQAEPWRWKTTSGKLHTLTAEDGDVGEVVRGTVKDYLEGLGFIVTTVSSEDELSRRKNIDPDIVMSGSVEKFDVNARSLAATTSVGVEIGINIGIVNQADASTVSINVGSSYKPLKVAVSTPSRVADSVNTALSGAVDRIFEDAILIDRMIKVRATR